MTWPNTLWRGWDATVPDGGITDLGIFKLPICVHSCSCVSRSQSRWTLSIMWNALVCVHKNVEEPVCPVVELNGNIHVFKFRKANSTHVLHVCQPYCWGDRLGVWHSD